MCSLFFVRCVSDFVALNHFNNDLPLLEMIFILAKDGDVNREIEKCFIDPPDVNQNTNLGEEVSGEILLVKLIIYPLMLHWILSLRFGY